MAAPTGHSDLFSPSSGERLICCQGSAKASRGLPDKTTLFSSEGSDAHELASHRLLLALGKPSDVDIKSLSFYSQEMEDHISGYVSYCLEKVAIAQDKTKNPLTMVEQQVSTDRYGEGLFGTYDFAVLADGDLTIVDLKYGRGVSVSSVENVQLKIYALCLIETFKELYEINSITLCIYQPRLSNVSEWSTTKDELYKWGDSTLKDTIRKIKEGSEEFHPGKHCKFCKAKPICKVLRDKNMEIAKKDFNPPFLLRDEEVEDVLDHADEITDWLNTVKDYALSEALNGSTETMNYKTSYDFKYQFDEELYNQGTFENKPTPSSYSSGKANLIFNDGYVWKNAYGSGNEKNKITDKVTDRATDLGLELYYDKDFKNKVSDDELLTTLPKSYYVKQSINPDKAYVLLFDETNYKASSLYKKYLKEYTVKNVSSFQIYSFDNVFNIFTFPNNSEMQYLNAKVTVNGEEVTNSNVSVSVGNVYTIIVSKDALITPFA